MLGSQTYQDVCVCVCVRVFVCSAREEEGGFKGEIQRLGHGVKLEELAHELRPIPIPVKQTIPIHGGHKILLKVVHDAPGDTLIDRERLKRLPIIIELCQNELAVSSDEGARGISIVYLGHGFSLHVGQQVAAHDHVLAADGGGGFAGGGAGAVTEGKDVLILCVLQSGRVDIDPARGVGDGGALHDLNGAHVRGNVHEVILEHFLLTRLQILKHTLLGSVAHGNQIAGEIQLDFPVLTNLSQSFGVFRNAENLVACVVKHHVDIVPYAAVAEVMLRHVHNLLGGAGAFDGGRGECEDCVTVLQRVNVLECVCDVFGRVVADDTVCLEGVFEPVDHVPVDLDTGGNNEVIVFDLVARSGDHCVFLRHEASSLGLKPVHIT
eukprot:comp20780_c0_seq1/m.27293 comp20780_c0_seq1/g.27293  ORF comp20780_c0_seq1/g.27293 comp20780_c0_seq1/m.27293 type:complete len:380 (+) comp20780_c0_seq1:519-1658(+)